MENLPFGASQSPFGAFSPQQNLLDLLTALLRRESAQKSFEGKSDLLRGTTVPPLGPGLSLGSGPPDPALAGLGQPNTALSFLGGTTMTGLPGGGISMPGGGQAEAEAVSPPQRMPAWLPTQLPPTVSAGMPDAVPRNDRMPAGSPMGQPMQGGPESGYIKSALMMIQAAINPDKVAPVADAAGIPVPDLEAFRKGPSMGGPAQPGFLAAKDPVPSTGSLRVGPKDQSRIAAEGENPHAVANSPLLQALLPAAKDPSRIAAEETPPLPMPLVPGMDPGLPAPLPFRSGVPDDPMLPDALIPPAITGGPETPGVGPPIDLAAPLSPSTAVPTPGASPIASLMKALSGVKVDPNATRRPTAPGSAGVVLPKDYTDFTQLLMALMQAQQGPQLGPLLGGGGGY